MFTMKALLLVGAVAAVGVFHTLVPDHWAPIAVLARHRGWSRRQTARAAAGAGLGHTLSTLVIAIAVWAAGIAFAARLGHLLNVIAGFALIGFGLWIFAGALREIHEQDSAIARGSHEPVKGHSHIHQHEGGPIHTHWHVHDAATFHDVEGALAVSPPLHMHEHATSARTALLLILGSSPMVEGIPVFFAAAPLGVGLIVAMSLVFAAATIGTYVALCVASSEGLGMLRLGRFERYGEVLSGAVIALIGAVFLIFFR